MSAPLISVITPTYNHAGYLPRCVGSLQAQSYPNWELVIVDDGSTDDTQRVVKAFDDPHITYIRQTNLGVRRLAETINKGLRRTTGELVTMLASDDTWPTYRLATQVRVFEDPEVVLAFGRSTLIDEKDRALGESRPPPHPERVMNRPPGTALHDLFLENFIPQPSVLLRRSALDQLGGYIQPPGLYAEDYPTHMALALIGEFRYQDVSLGNYRMHQSQMTRNHYLRMVETDIAYVLEFYRGLDPRAQQSTGWSEGQLRNALQKRLHNARFQVGRRALLAENWTEARQQFIAALVAADTRTRFKAAVGLACTFVHRDLEGLARLARRAPLR